MIAEAPRARAPEILIKRAWVPEDLDRMLRDYRPRTEVGQLFRRIAADPRLDLAMRAELLQAVSRIWVMQSRLELRVYRGLDGTPWRHPTDRYRREAAYRAGLAERPEAERWAIVARHGGSYHPLLTPQDPLWARLVEDYGVVSRKVITNEGVDEMVSDFAGAGGDISNFHFHGIGTGTNAEAQTDGALQTELTTEYNPNSTRATGSQVQNMGPTPDTFTTVGTNTLDSGTPAVTEHGIFSTASTATSLLWDRSVFSAINLVGANGDGLQSTYTLTINAGG